MITDIMNYWNAFEECVKKEAHLDAATFGAGGYGVFGHVHRDAIKREFGDMTDEDVDYVVKKYTNTFRPNKTTAVREYNLRDPR